MAQVNVTLSDKINESLNELSEVTGLSKSSLIAEYVRRGIYQDVDSEAKLAEFRSLLAQQQSKSSGKRQGGKSG
jgi:predicted DNA-binding protein